MQNISKIQTMLKNVIDYGWQVIELKNCGLTEIPVELYNHPQIVSIDLSNDEFIEEQYKNKIKEIPSDISKIKNLARLDLENNLVEKVNENISQLRKLNYLNLNNNRLSEISEKIANMDGLKSLLLENNPFEMLPPEIVSRGIDSIRNFFSELKEQDFIYEVKLLIVGEGRVGKTCLSRALVNDNYSLENEDSTEGINIHSWVVPYEKIKKINSKIERDFQINIWDFGGQEIYHSTHQFFLTKRSLYLLVTESRKEDSHDDFFYWLNIIKLLGDKSPVIMVLNKCDQPTKELPIKEYKHAFNNIVDFNKISLKLECKESFCQFKENLIKFATELPHIGTPLPKVWVDIRRDLENLKISGKNYITKSEYLEICKKHYRKEDSALFLSEFFHDLGVILHFQNDVELRDLVILNHEWITSGVYKILDDRQVISQKGRFTHDDIIRIWSDDDYKDKIRELISLMKNTKFDLCFELSNGEYLVPRLLPVDEVDHNWVSKPDNTKFEFSYKFMPKGILTRLIVKMNSDIVDEKYWRYGVILEYDETKAIIKEKYFENKITIELEGKNKREFLYLIRKTINEIHKDFNNLEFSEMVPCNCSTCSTIDNPHFYDFNLLKRYEQNEIPRIRCDKSLVEVTVFSLTNDISRKKFSNEKIIICENQNAGLLNSIGLENFIFVPEKDSSSVYIKTTTNIDYYGLRDRDFLLDEEIEKIKSKYTNYFILNYYCIENYLYHPDNIGELKLAGFNKDEYIKEIVRQKNEIIIDIISNFKRARTSYQEFKIQENKFEIKEKEMKIADYLRSDTVETFFKSYSMKDKFKKDMLMKYGLKYEELANTRWFKENILSILNNE